MYNLLFQVSNIVADIMVFLFAGYYLFSYLRKERQLEKKEKALAEKEGKIDIDYHHIVDNALTRERKILEDAASEADTIITQAQLATQSTQEKVDKALEHIVAEVQKETGTVARSYMAEYQTSIRQIADQTLQEVQNVTKEMAVANKALQDAVVNIQQETAHTTQSITAGYQDAVKQVAVQSLTRFHSVTHELEADLQKQINNFQETLLPALEKEVEAYKQERLKQVEQLINHIIQKVSQKALNRTLPIEDHKNLIIESLEKAKKEGVFD